MQNSTEILAASKSYTSEEAFDFCARVANSHYENFPVASFFLPAEKRPYIQVIYAFSRIADDFADESTVDPRARLAKLAEWEEMLVRCYAGDASHPVFIALSETISRLDIPIEPLKDLLTAFRWDVTKNRYETFSELLEYCRCSANPVGRLVLMIFNYRKDELFHLSDKICTALQLTNFWQDIAIDRRKDRLYIPLEDLRNEGYLVEDWNKETYDENFKRTMKTEIGRTRTMFYEGATLPALVDTDLSLELKLIWLGGMAILRRIEKIRFDLYRQRPVLKTLQKFRILLRAFRHGDLTTYGKPKPKKELWDLT